MPQIVWREKGTFKIKYLTKKERELIEQIKVTNNYKTLKEAYFHYIENEDLRDKPVDTSNNNILELQKKYEEQIKILENTILQLQKENIKLTKENEDLRDKPVDTSNNNILELQKKYEEQIKENKFTIERLTKYCKERNVNIGYFLYSKS